MQILADGYLHEVSVSFHKFTLVRDIAVRVFAFRHRTNPTDLWTTIAWRWILVVWGLKVQRFMTSPGQILPQG